MIIVIAHKANGQNEITWEGGDDMMCLKMMEEAVDTMKRRANLIVPGPGVVPGPGNPLFKQ